MGYKFRVANAPCSWGVLEFDLEGEAAGYEQVLDEIAETGYAGTELGDWGFMPTDPAALRAELDKRRLALLAAFVPVALADASAHAAGEEVCLRTARLLAGTAGPECFIVLADNNGSVPLRTQNAGRVTPDMGLTDAQWQTFAEGANRIARAVKELGTWKLTVRPERLDASHPLALVPGGYMGVLYETDINGQIFARIREENPYPTAAAVLRDVINLYQ